MTTSWDAATGLEIDNPVGGDGPDFPAGRCSRASKYRRQRHVIKVLHDHGRLLKDEPYHHSYPHCWRHKTPVISVRRRSGSSAWKQAGLRKGALEAISHVDWMPTWGEQRISGHDRGRPDWCVSRQRTWACPSVVRGQGIRRAANREPAS